MAHSCISMILSVLLAQIASSNGAASSSFLENLAATNGVDAKAAETVRALDTNGNGKVDKNEIANFAKSQGLSTQEVLADFQELDANKDGELDATEINGLLGDGDAPQTSVPSLVAAQPAAPKAAAPTTVAERHEAVAATIPTKLQAPQTAKHPSMGFDLAALEQDAQQQAGNVMANRLAQRAQVLLARSAADETKAKAFDAEVHRLRGNATSLASSVNNEVREVARKASDDVAHKSMEKLNHLQDQEHKAERDADAHRDQAKQAMKRVHKAQESLRI